MSDAKLKTRIKRLFKSHLEPVGFSLKRPRIVERKLQGLRQGIEFQPGTGSLDRKFTLNIYWSFTHACDDSMCMDVCRRISTLVEGMGNEWFSREDDKLDTDFPIVEKLVLDVVLPFLEKYDSIEKIVRAYTTGALPAIETFGIDEAWRFFNLAYCHAYLGNTAEAKKYYNIVISTHSSKTVDWVQGRKRAAMEEVNRLGDSSQSI